MQEEWRVPQNMDFLLDIPLEITVELGSSKITIGELLKLSQGSVVELNKLTDEPLDIFVNKSSWPSCSQKFGIRLTNIVSPGGKGEGPVMTIMTSTQRRSELTDGLGMLFK